VKVLLATAEIAPWVREGASAAAAAGLARGLAEAGVRTTVAVPDYPVFSGLRGLVRGRRRPIKVPAATGPLRGAWTEAELDGCRLALVEKPEFFDRAGIYGTGGEPYEDNLARFSFFARAVSEIARATSADVVHSLDWPGALVAARGPRDGRPVTLGLQNFIFQGDFPAARFPESGMTWEDFGRFEFFGRGNALKAGLLSASAVVLPGSRMAHAVCSPGAGCGLEGVAESAGSRLHGILAGADYDGWLDAGSAEGRERKQAARRSWLSSLKLEPLGPEGLLVVLPPALCGGTGLDLVLPVLDRLMEFPLRLVVLGHPGLTHAPALQLAGLRHAGRFLLLTRDDDATWRAAAAAADAMLLPGALEPAADLRLACSLRSGAVPLIQSCPGLREIVQDHDPAGTPGNGLVFYRHDPEALADNFRRAFQLRRDGAWDGLTTRAAASDFSWDAAASRYIELFRRIAGI
jgi:starch synthase